MARAGSGVTTATVESEIRSAFSAVANQLPLEIAPLEEAVQATIGRDRLVAQLSAAFGILGIVLASMGLYAAIAHTVSSRTREIGIRIALGAATRHVIWMVLKESLRVTAIGVLIGVPVAIAGSHLIDSLLFGVASSDPITLIASTAILGVTALLAAWLPSRRAARINPSRTLKYE
jgi:ABC-type antimicrobial peptide transport system permease subunit